MLEVLKVITMLCQVYSANGYPSVVMERQQECQRKLIQCIGDPYKKDGDTTEYKIYKCVGKKL